MSAVRSHPGIVLAILLACCGARASDFPPPPSTAARTVFEQTRDAVVKVRSTVAGHNSSTGSAYLLRPDGLLATNYHVVADHVFDPATYQLSYQTHDGREGPLKLVAIDVVNDVALVKSDLTTAQPLPIRSAAPDKGDTVFSLGYPLNQGITVTEGTYNGISEDLYREHLHFTGAVNPGMSGGPVVDRRGEIVGMNVAHRRNAQLVSFLVPGRFVAALLASAANAASGSDFERDAWSQLGAYTTRLLQETTAAAWRSRSLGGFTLPAEQLPRMQCVHDVSKDETDKTAQETLLCNIKSGLFLTDRLVPGQLSIRHTLYRNQRLAAPQFNQFIQARFANEVSVRRREKDFQPVRCLDRVVALQGGPFKVVLCSAAYRRHEQLHDVMLRIVSLTDSREAVITQVDLGAVSADVALRYIDRYLGSLQSNPR